MELDGHSSILGPLADKSSARCWASADHVVQGGSADDEASAYRLGGLFIFGAVAETSRRQGEKHGERRANAFAYGQLLLMATGAVVRPSRKSDRRFTGAVDRSEDTRQYSPKSVRPPVERSV